MKKKKNKVYIFFSFSCENFIWSFRLSVYLQESDDADLEEEDVKDDLRLLFFFVCLCWGFTAQSTQRGHVERGQLT